MLTFKTRLQELKTSRTLQTGENSLIIEIYILRNRTRVHSECQIPEVYGGKNKKKLL
jgi:hypothetical protein